MTAINHKSFVTYMYQRISIQKAKNNSNHDISDDHFVSYASLENIFVSIKPLLVSSEQLLSSKAVPNDF